MEGGVSQRLYTDMKQYGSWLHCLQLYNFCQISKALKLQVPHLEPGNNKIVEVLEENNMFRILGKGGFLKQDIESKATEKEKKFISLVQNYVLL